MNEKQNERTSARRSHSVPAPPKHDYVRFIPLGGLDEVGMNCALLECNGSMVMIDCGLTFPEDEYGIDVVLPDWAYVMDNLDRLDAVLITHGHEDHIGALPFFLQEVDVPIYSGRLTLAMLNAKLQSHNLGGQVELIGVEPGETVEIGSFIVEFLHTNHSVPNAMSLALNTPLGNFIFTGDWKLDQTPLYEAPMDLGRFAAIGNEGVVGLFGDSTNSEVPGFSTSERQVFDGLDDVLDGADGRVIVAQFSSNLYRVRGMLDLARQHGRKVALLGRSLTRNFNLACEEGFMEVPADNLVIDAREIDNYPPEKLLIISTGSQAEPRASLTRMGLGDHRQVTLNATDTIVLSARRIPGNERGIYNMLNNLAKHGATIITAANAPIHATGHAKQEELKLMLNVTRPQVLVPVHGEYRMRMRHAELGEAVGVPQRRLIENGDVLQFDTTGARVVGQVHTGRLLVDGKYMGDQKEMVLRDRAKLAQSGIIVAVVTIERHSGDISVPPELLQKGFLGDPEIEHLLVEAADYALQAIEDLSLKARKDTNEVRDAMRTSLRRFFRKNLDRKPVVIPVVHEV
jgi:ribonuclease J